MSYRASLSYVRGISNKKAYSRVEAHYLLTISVKAAERGLCPRRGLIIAVFRRDGLEDSRNVERVEECAPRLGNLYARKVSY